MERWQRHSVLYALNDCGAGVASAVLEKPKRKYLLTVDWLQAEIYRDMKRYVVRPSWCMGIWQEHFSWRILSRWDFLGVLIPGFPVAIGVGSLGIDWFPHNLLISQICFGLVGLILWLKFVAVAVQAANQGLFSRITFSIFVTIVLFGSSATTIATIQTHKIQGEQDKEQAALFTSIDEFILRKDEIALRETFDIPTVTKDAILEAKIELTPQFASQIDKDTVARDMIDGKNVFFYRYIRVDGTQISPMPGKSGILHLTPKAVSAKEKLKSFYSSALVPADVAEPLRGLEKALSDDQELLMDTINEAYATNPSSISNAFDCPKEDCNTVVDKFYPRYIQLRPKAEAVTDAIRKYREAHK